MLKRIAAISLLLIAPSAHAGTITGQVKNLDGTPLIEAESSFAASVQTRAGRELVTSVSVVKSAPGVVPVTITYTIVFDDTRLSTTDHLINVTMNSNLREPVILQGLDGKQPTFNIDVIMPKAVVPPPQCRVYSPYVYCYPTYQAVPARHHFGFAGGRFGRH